MRVNTRRVCLAVKELRSRFHLFQDGERCRFLAQESRASDSQGVSARKVQAAKGNATEHQHARQCSRLTFTFLFTTPTLTTASI